MSWLGGYAAIGGLEITQSEPAFRARERISGIEATKKYTEEFGGIAFHERLGLPDGSLKFLALHLYKDRFHGGGELALLVKYANTRSLQKEALWAARATIQILSMHLAEIRRLASEAAGVTDLALAKA